MLLPQLIPMANWQKSRQLGSVFHGDWCHMLGVVCTVPPSIYSLSKVANSCGGTSSQWEELQVPDRLFMCCQWTTGQSVDAHSLLSSTNGLASGQGPGRNKAGGLRTDNLRKSPLDVPVGTEKKCLKLMLMTTREHLTQRKDGMTWPWMLANLRPWPAHCLTPGPKGWPWWQLCMGSVTWLHSSGLTQLLAVPDAYPDSSRGQNWWLSRASCLHATVSCLVEVQIHRSPCPSKAAIVLNRINTCSG